MNYSYTEVNIAADQVLLYKLVCRQVAARYEMTACFLPKPVTGVNGNGMHTNLSIARKGKNSSLMRKGRTVFRNPAGRSSIGSWGAARRSAWS